MIKFKNFLLNKGIYLIAIGCVAIVCLSGLYIANVMDKGKVDPIESGAVSSTSDAQDVIALPPRKTDAAAATGTATPTQTIAPFQTPPAFTSSVPANATAAPTPTPVEIKLDMPVKGNIIVDYAMDKLVYNKTLDEWRTHCGVDIAAEAGTEVKAAGDGKIIDVKNDPRLGYLIIVEHSSTLKTIYANLKEEIDVKIGDSVKKGDVIGWVGRTAPFEYADEPHLHFEVLVNDNCVNVWNYVTRE